jgi:hypothetical protein
MKNNITRVLSGIGLAIAVLATSQPFVASALIPQANASGAALNVHPQDFPVLEVSNYSRCPGSNSCWSSSISGVRAGETIAFVMYAHNTGTDGANNTRVQLQLDENGSQARGIATISADNASAVSGQVYVGFDQSVRTPVTLTYVGGEYYRQSSLDPTGPDALPSGQSPRAVTQGGVNVGTLPADAYGSWNNDMQLVVRYRVDGETTSCTAATLNVTPDTQTVRVGETAQYRAIYDSNGNCAGGQTDVTNSASWTDGDFASVATSLGQGRFRGTREGTGSVRASYNGLSDSATLRVTGNGGGECSSATLRVTPTRDTVDVGDEAQYRAIYDSNGDCSGGESDVTNSADWSVDSSNIATDLGEGEFRGRREGSTTVRARYSGLTDTATLRVNDDDDDSCDDDATLVIVPFNATVGVNQTFQYRALYDADGPGCSDNGDRDVSGSATWTVSNSGIASSLGSGSVRGNAGGNTAVFARYNGITANANMTVVATGGPIIQQPPVIIQQPPVIIGGGTVVQPIVAGVSTDSTVSCITVTPSIDVDTLLPNQEFVYTTLYRNDCPFALNNAVLRVFMPNEVDVLASSNPFFIREGQKMSYNLGTLPPGGQGSVAITGYVRKDSRIGDTLTFTSSIEFLDSTNRIQNASSYLVAILGGSISRPLTASLTDTLGMIFGSGWFWLLFAILLLVGLAWFIWTLLARRNETKVVVARADEDPLRALRNA